MNIEAAPTSWNSDLGRSLVF